MYHYLITITYDGTKYYGWQRLSNQPSTIQNIIENALSKFTSEKIKINGSGRTDAGVSALGQTADFYSNILLDESTFLQNVNMMLPTDIQILKLQYINSRKYPDFHARKSAIAKHYRYTVSLTEKGNPFTCRYEYHLKETPLKLDFRNYCQDESNYASQPYMNLNMQEIDQCCQYLCGTHDFSAFTSDKSTDKSHVRTISQITCTLNDGLFPTLTMDFVGDGFLYNMVRILAGTILCCGLNQQKYSIIASQIPDILESKERKNAGPTLPSNGLMLVSVTYDHFS